MPRAKPDQPAPGSKGTTLDMLRDEGVLRDPLKSRRHTPTPDAWTGLDQDRSTYYTTTQFAEIMGVQVPQVVRWCQRWYGSLPPTRGTKGQGYRIHPYMVKVARAWKQTEDPIVREAARAALVEAPRNYVVVVANRGSTHYSVIEAMRRVEILLTSATEHSKPVTVLYVGEPNTPGTKGKTKT